MVPARMKDYIYYIVGHRYPPPSRCLFIFTLPFARHFLVIEDVFVGLSNLHAFENLLAVAKDRYCRCGQFCWPR